MFVVDNVLRLPFSVKSRFDFSKFNRMTLSDSALLSPRHVIPESAMSEFKRTDAERKLPLEGIRILDLTSVVMGPVCTQILADYGAEVVKVEPPEGDIMRHAGAKREAAMGAMFLHSNEGKKSVVLDLKNAVDHAALKRMVGSFDVLVHNVRPQAMKRLGLDETTVRRECPSIVYAELTGYGEGGPLGGRAAFDDIIQAQVGLAELFARQSGGAPAYVPTLIADRVTGITAAHAILAALIRRQRDGLGDTIKISMFETMAAFVLADHLGDASFEPFSGPMGYNRLLTPHRKPYRTRDGYIAVVVYNDKHWRSFFSTIGELEKFESDTRFQTAAARADNYDAIYAYLAETMLTRTNHEWLEVLSAADIPCAPVNRVEDLISDQQLGAVGFFEQSDTSQAYALRRVAARYRSPIVRPVSPSAAPRLGQHSSEFLDTQFLSPREPYAE